MSESDHNGENMIRRGSTPPFKDEGVSKGQFLPPFAAGRTLLGVSEKGTPPFTGTTTVVSGLGDIRIETDTKGRQIIEVSPPKNPESGNKK